MPPKATLKVQGLKNIMQRFYDRLHEHREALNRLNVYPVPDGDTGTNMALTVASVVDEVSGSQTMEELSTAIAHGSLMGARGNSGVILSQILRGLADTFRSADTVGAEQIVDAFDQASAAAYDAVMRPVEGTILTVLREAAEAARDADTPEGEDLAGLLRRTYDRAELSLQNTPELLPVLKEAGVVDAGGAGFLLLMAAFLEEVTGEETVLPAEIFKAVAGVIAEEAGAEHDISGLRYEVMYFLEAEQAAVEVFKREWMEIGDSIVVVGGDGTYNCHIHTDDIGESIEAGIRAGRPFRLQITDLLDQAETEAKHHHPSVFEPLPAFATADIGVVAVAIGSGIVEMFRQLGVQGVVVGGQTMNPSTEELLAAVADVSAREVVILPNNKNIIPVAKQLDSLSDKAVVCVPTRSVPEGLAAMVSYLPSGQGIGVVADGMESAMGDVASGEITQAVRESNTPAGHVREGDWMGIIGGDVAVIETELDEALTGLLAHLAAADREIVTIITGTDADRAVTEAAAAWLEEEFDLEVEVVAGSQPLYPYLVSVE
ncbi:MAG: DAK2 domain-containing protein [Acidimicrobiia bacterium]|nr:DAK2 domain-containing protein [Acidimicrobiia bacterium]